jgi:AAA+ ATPase superfamily predicted ATPase
LPGFSSTRRAARRFGQQNLTKSHFVMTAFVGRDLELGELKEPARLEVASLVVIKVRRRVGKSRLATEFAAHVQQKLAPARRDLGGRSQDP